MTNREASQRLMEAAWEGDIGGCVHGLDCVHMNKPTASYVMDCPVEAAAANGQALALSWLLDAGASLDGRHDGDIAPGWPLMFAVLGRHRECAELLLSRGARVQLWYSNFEDMDRLREWGLVADEPVKDDKS